MTEKNTYWIADPDGNKALVEGADERDRWTRLHGWTETTEPDRQDFVWLEHEETGGRQRFVAEAVPLWEPRGWRPSPPPEPVNLALPNDPTEPGPAPAKASTSTPTTSKPEAKATGGSDKKESS